MKNLRSVISFLILFGTVWLLSATSSLYGQTNLKKVRIGVSETHVGYLPLQVAYHKGYYREEGIDLEIVLMQTNVINTAALTGQIDINGAVTGTVGAAVQGSPMKLLIVTVGKPLLFLVSRKEIKEPGDLRGKRIAGSSPGGTATVLARQALRHFGIDPEKDAAVLPMGGSTSSRFAAMESGVVDATMLPVPAVIFAKAKGFNELAFMGDIVQFPQNGFGATDKIIRENPDEIYRMVRASLRGLVFMSEPKNREEVVQIVMKQHKVTDRKLAEQMLAYSQRVITKQAQVSENEIQFLIDLMRTTAKVTRPVAVSEVVDFSFLEKARRDLGLKR
ncbi:MAG TPA: ABC transporter substrate-binding protein [Candidatus Limnocylindria bacterium]|nr:ABC transporter substrate-binding protein [Candidatus Limnocylindria bacterium]